MSKQLYTLEFPVRCSPPILFEFLSTPAGLGEWFADKVDERDNIFYFDRVRYSRVNQLPILPSLSATFHF